MDTHAPARVVGGKRVPGANPNRPHKDEDGATAQTTVTNALEPGGGQQALVVQEVPGDSFEKAKVKTFSLFVFGGGEGVGGLGSYGSAEFFTNLLFLVLTVRYPKHDRVRPVHEPKHDKNYNRAPDVKKTHTIQQPGNHHQ